MADHHSTHAHAKKSKWDQRYQKSTEPGAPCWVLENNLHLLPTSGSSLDLACGLGANALCLAEHGLTSHAWDISSVGLKKLSGFAHQKNLSVFTQQKNIEHSPPEKNSFDVIVVSHFLFRPMFHALVAALKPNGLLFYQTFNQQKITDSGPGNPDFLLAPNELLHLMPSLELVFYREDGRHGSLQHGLRNCSYYIGCRR